MFWYSHVYLFVLEQTQKKQRRKVKPDTIPHRTQKMHWTKIIGTHNLIFGSTPFGKNNWNQSLPVTMNEFLYWNFGPPFFCKLLQVIQIWRMPSPNRWFEISPHHRCSMGFSSGPIAGHFRTLQRFVCNPFWVLFEMCFGSQQDDMLSSLCRRICAVLNWPPPVFAFFCLQLVLWRNCDVKPKRVYRPLQCL